MIHFILKILKLKQHNGETDDEQEDIDDDTFENNKNDYDEYLDSEDKNLLEHLNPKSYSWCLIRYSAVKLSLHHIITIMNIIGIEIHEIAILSPCVYEVIKSFERLMENLKSELNELDGPPDNYMNDYSTGFNGPKHFQYQTILNPENTPFNK